MRRVFFNRIVLAALFALLLGAAFLLAQRQEPLVHELAPGVFYWQGDEILRVQTNVGWVIFDDYVLVIDANFPWGARQILPEIRKTTTKPIRFLFDTHYHADHAYGNVIFHEAGAAIVSSIDCSEEARRKGWRDVQNQAKERVSEPLVYPSVTFKDRMVFDDGSHRVELIHVGPAHTKGDAVAYLPKEKILFVGDLAVNWVYGNNVSDVDADPHHWLKALDDLSKWNIQTVIPAHGVPGGMEVIRGQHDYFGEMITAVEAGIKTGKTAEQIAGEVNLTRYQPFGAEPRRSAGQIRSMYRKLAVKAQ
jgi:cyclase